MNFPEQDEKCSAHALTASSLDSITSAVSRLEQAQGSTAAVQMEMATSLAVMANTLEKIENTDVIIERLNGKIVAMFDAFEKSEREHDDLFNRLRAVETITTEHTEMCKTGNKRLGTIEKRNVWFDRLVIGSIILGMVGMGFHIIKGRGGTSMYYVDGYRTDPAKKQVQ